MVLNTPLSYRDITMQITPEHFLTLGYKQSSKLRVPVTNKTLGSDFCHQYYSPLWNFWIEKSFRLLQTIPIVMGNRPKGSTPEVFM